MNTFYYLDALEKLCPHFEMLNEIVSEKPNVKPLFLTTSRGKSRISSASSTSVLTKFHPFESEEENNNDSDNVDDDDEQDDEDNPVTIVSAIKRKAKDTSAATMTFNKFEYKRSRGNKAYGFGDALYYSNELKAELEGKKMEQQERERAEDRKQQEQIRAEDMKQQEMTRAEETRRWELQSQHHHSEKMQELEIQRLQIEMQSKKFDIELELLKRRA